MPQILGFHYTLKDTTGNVIDSSSGRDPMLIMTERGMIIPGLESEIKNMIIGSKKTIIVAPKDGYGEVDETLRIKANKSQFPDGTDLPEGGQFQSEIGGQPRVFTIVKVDGEDVYIDGNHMLAGHELHFDVEITERRDPTAEELQHGHAHGVGGHNH